MSRERAIETAPRNGGKLCEALESAQIAPCGLEPCRAALDCEFGAWSDWDYGPTITVSSICMGRQLVGAKKK